ncbi:MAG: lasso peptide biosynthesis protein [Syntrophaceae bacterium]
MNFRKLLKVISVYLGTFWYGWILVYDVKRSELPVIDYLDGLAQRKKRRCGLEAEEICSLIANSSSHFWFHRQQSCLAQSLVLYYYLRIYGYAPFLIMEIDFNCDRYYNCHAWVSLDGDLESCRFENVKVLNRYKNFILVEKVTEHKGETDGKYPSHESLQSALPVLFCRKNNGSKKR